MNNYKSIFIDLDDTLWDFSANARDTFEEVYLLHGLNSFFDSFEQFFTIYEEHNLFLWKEYGDGKITKEELNHERFLYPLNQAGISDEALAKAYSESFFERIPYKKKLKPHALELLNYLHPKYSLYILSNGFRELQERKMHSAGINHFFKKIVLSEDLGVLKPHAELYYFALSATQSDLRHSIMIGDNFDVDIAGAHGVGMNQIYYNPGAKKVEGFKPTFEIRDLAEVCEIL